MNGPSLFGTTFQNAVLLASGTAGFGHEVAGVIDLDALGGIVTKAVTPEPRRGHPAPRVAEFRGGMLNAVGLANPGLRTVRDQHLPKITAALRRARVLVNVAGSVIEDYICVLQGLSDHPGITAFEINASCPNTAQGGLEFGQSTTALADLVRRCREVTRRPLVIKLSPVLPDIAEMAAVARDEGADGITLVNTMPGMLAGRLGHTSGGVSGPALLPIGVLATRRVRARIDIPIIGVGGIRTVRDARQYLEAGASLVAIGTAALADPKVPERIARGLQHG